MFGLALRRLFISGLAFVMGGSSWAAPIFGEYLPEHELPEQVCAVIFKFPTGGVRSLCSGIVVGPNTVLTAGHCLDETLEIEYFDISVRCPHSAEKSVEKGEDNRVLHSDYDRETIGGKTVSLDGDLGLLKTSQAFPFSELRVSRSVGHSERLMKRNHCAIFGYGVDNFFKIGSLRGSKVDLGKIPNWSLLRYLNSGRIDIATPGTERTLKAPDGKTYKVRTTVTPGDSGGGLLCQDEDEEWFVIGVNSTYNGSFFFSLQGVSQERDWIFQFETEKETYVGNEWINWIPELEMKVILLQRRVATCSSLLEGNFDRFWDPVPLPDPLQNLLWQLQNVETPSGWAATTEDYVDGLEDLKQELRKRLGSCFDEFHRLKAKDRAVETIPEIITNEMASAGGWTNEPMPSGFTPEKSILDWVKDQFRKLLPKIPKRREEAGPRKVYF